LPARIALYNRQVVSELRKVIWPTRNELVTYTIVSVVFVVSMVAFVGFLDYLFTKLVFAMFG
jgi:preprotein translocase subunit SecE